MITPDLPSVDGRSSLRARVGLALLGGFAVASALATVSATPAQAVTADDTLYCGGATYDANTLTCSRTWTGYADTTWTVPADVSTVTITVRGAAGGAGGEDERPGGNSVYVGSVTGDISVSGGTALRIAPGSAGGNGTGWCSGFSGGGGGSNALGYSGGSGGRAGWGGVSCMYSGSGGGGGAASAIRISGVDIVAGGGGGGGGANYGSYGVNSSATHTANGTAITGGAGWGTSDQQNQAGAGGGGGGAYGGIGGPGEWVASSPGGNSAGGRSGLTLSYVASSSGQAGSITVRYAAALAPVSQSAPAVGASPKLSTAYAATSTGTWAAAPAATLTYQWLACTSTSTSSSASGALVIPASCSAVTGDGATSSTYTPQISTMGSYLRLAVTATNTWGTTTALSATSANPVQVPTPVVALAPASDTGSSASDRLTSATSPTIELTSLVPSGTVTVTAVKGGLTETCSFTASATTGSCALSNLVDGTWSITAEQSVNSTLSPTSATLSVTVDTLAPTALSATVSVGGTPLVADASTVVTTSTGVSVASLTATDADGTLTYLCSLDGATPTACASGYSALASGAHTLVITAVDRSGNTSTAKTFSWTVVGVPTLDLVAGSDTGSSSTDNFTSDTTPTISVGNLTGGATVTVTATKNSSTATCSFTATASTGTCDLSALVDGTWSVTTTQSLGGTGVSAASPLSVTVDTVAPTALSATVSVGGTPLVADAATVVATATSVSVASLTATDADGTLTYLCSLDGVTATSCASSYTGLASGAHTLVVTAVDRSGNTSTAKTYSWTVVGVPTLDLVAGSDTGSSSTDNFTSDTTPTMSVGNLTGGATVTVTATKNAVTATCSFTASSSSGTCDLPVMTDGTWSIAVSQSLNSTAVNGAAPLSVTVDTIAPTALSATVSVGGTPLVADAATVVATATSVSVASLTATDADGTLTYLCSLDGATATTCASSYTGLASGAHTLVITAVDRAGNASTAKTYSWTVVGVPTIDLVADSDTGASSTDNITSDTTPTISVGNLTFGAVVTVTATKNAVTATCSFTATASTGTCDLALPSAPVGVSDGIWSIVAAQALGASTVSSSSLSTTLVGGHAISLSSPGDQLPGAGPLTLVTASDVNPAWIPTLASATPGVCTVSGTTVTLVGTGTCTLTSTHAGGSYASRTYEQGLASVTFIVGYPQQTAVQPTTDPEAELLPGSGAGPEITGAGGQDGARPTSGLRRPPQPVRTVVTPIPGRDGSGRVKVTVTLPATTAQAPISSLVLVIFDETRRAVKRIAVPVEPGAKSASVVIPQLAQGYQVKSYSTNAAGVSDRAPVGANVLRKPTSLGKRADGSPILFGKRISRPVRFGPDSPVLDESARADLDTVVKYVAKNGGRVFITGLVRNGGGSVADQKRLSGDRAKNVAVYLSSRGVDTWIRFDGYGARTTGIGQPTDRRVEVRWSTDEIPSLRSLPPSQSLVRPIASSATGLGE